MDVFSSLIEEQKSKSEVAQLFGVILYTDKHPNIKKVKNQGQVLPFALRPNVSDKQ